jgi:hypothetical protein
MGALYGRNLSFPVLLLLFLPDVDIAKLLSPGFLSSSGCCKPSMIAVSVKGCGCMAFGLKQRKRM